MPLLDSLPHTSLMAAFLAGLLSGLSPAAPAVGFGSLIYLIGMTLHERARTEECEPEQHVIVVHTLWFLAGFSAVFIAVSATTTFIGLWLVAYKVAFRHAGAILIIMVGFYVATIANPFFFPLCKQVHINARSIRYAVSCAVGGTFATAWTPSVAPALGVALLSINNAGTMLDGLTLLTFYSMGFGIPLLVLSVILCRLAARFGCCPTTLALTSGFCGFCLILVGAALYADRLTSLAAASGTPDRMPL